MSTVSKAITAVYVGMYNRAADLDGFNWWLSNFGGDPDAAVTAQQMSLLSKGFADNPYFTTAYPPSMSDSDFINQLYLNIGGNAGDSEGVGYWQGRLAELGNDRTEMVAEFLYGFINIDLSSKPTGLTDAEYQQALQRQGSLMNKVEVSEVFRDTLGEGSNVSVNDPALFDTDPAFMLSRSIISGVNYESANKTWAIAEIKTLAGEAVELPIDDNPKDVIFLNGNQTYTVELSLRNKKFMLDTFEPELDRFELSADLKSVIGAIDYTGEVSTYEDLESPGYLSGVAGQAAIVKNTGMYWVNGTYTGVSQLIIDLNGDGQYESADDMAVGLVGVWQLEDYNFV